MDDYFFSSRREFFSARLCPTGVAHFFSGRQQLLRPERVYLHMKPRILLYAAASLTLLLFYAPFHAISAFLAGLLDRFRKAGRTALSTPRLAVRLAPLPVQIEPRARRTQPVL